VYNVVEKTATCRHSSKSNPSCHRRKNCDSSTWRRRRRK